jgi:hypothetical protein
VKCDPECEGRDGDNHARILLNYPALERAATFTRFLRIRGNDYREFCFGREIPAEADNETRANVIDAQDAGSNRPFTPGLQERIQAWLVAKRRHLSWA